MATKTGRKRAADRGREIGEEEEEEEGRGEGHDGVARFGMRAGNGAHVGVDGGGFYFSSQCTWARTGPTPTQ